VTYEVHPVGWRANLVCPKCGGPCCYSYLKKSSLLYVVYRVRYRHCHDCGYEAPERYEFRLPVKPQYAKFHGIGIIRSFDSEHQMYRFIKVLKEFRKLEWWSDRDILG
jgi:hypothetical protein